MKGECLRFVVKGSFLSHAKIISLFAEVYLMQRFSGAGVGHEYILCSFLKTCAVNVYIDVWYVLDTLDGFFYLTLSAVRCVLADRKLLRPDYDRGINVKVFC